MPDNSYSENPVNENFTSPKPYRVEVKPYKFEKKKKYNLDILDVNGNKRKEVKVNDSYYVWINTSGEIMDYEV